MKAISLWQPWATLIALGIKLTETRHWATKHRGRTAIHAAQRWHADQQAAALEFAKQHPEHEMAILSPPRGKVVAVTDIVDCYQFELGLPDYVTDADYAAGDMSPGRFGWRMDNTLRLNDPVPARGRQRIWSLTGEAMAQVLQQLNRTAP